MIQKEIDLALEYVKVVKVVAVRPKVGGTQMHVGTECVRDQEYRQYDNADFPRSQRHSKVCMIRSTSWHFGAFCAHHVEVTEWNQ